ncbi:MAG: acyl-CoA thioesterase [Pseudomonadales bacterium]|nr:acyl-CoA thioesterase [Pseudomonadales bacterium]MBH2077077.1 acyl-CoA thioesterase [Pseudomonadales bacterium]
MIESTEFVIARQPFTVRRTVRWVDCDPAGVAYTGRYTDYLIGAVMHFYAHIGWGPESENGGNGGLACKHMSLTFHKSLPPGSIVDMRIQVGEIRGRTFDLHVQAFLPDGQLAFEGVFSPICIAPDERRSLSLPQALREVLGAHQRAGAGGDHA